MNNSIIHLLLPNYLGGKSLEFSHENLFLYFLQLLDNLRADI